MRFPSSITKTLVPSLSIAASAGDDLGTGGDRVAVLDALTALQSDRKLGEVRVGSVAVEHGAVEKLRLRVAAVAVPGEIRGLGFPFFHQQPCCPKIKIGTVNLGCGFHVPRVGL